VRGEHGLDPQPLEQGRHLGRRDAGGGELCDGSLETALLGIARTAEIVASTPNPVNALGEIDDLEVRREGADQRFGITRRQALHQRLQLVVGSRDAGEPGPLDELEERVATLLADDVPDQRPERSDVVPQLRVLGSESDGAAFVNRKPPQV
jgi:hypothetical protein